MFLLIADLIAVRDHVLIFHATQFTHNFCYPIFATIVCLHGSILSFFALACHVGTSFASMASMVHVSFVLAGITASMATSSSHSDQHGHSHAEHDEDDHSHSHGDHGHSHGDHG